MFLTKRPFGRNIVIKDHPVNNSIGSQDLWSKIKVKNAKILI